MSIHIHRNSSNAGEISQLMDARTDSEKYRNSCRRLEGFIPRVYGGAFRRPGTLFVGKAGDQTKPVRLMALNVSATTRYVLEFGDEYLRVWNSDGSPFIDELNSPYTAVLELVTPYAAEDLDEVQMAQLGNLCYFAHPDYPPQKLARYFDASFGAAAFTWSAVSLAFPAFRDTNTSAITVTPSATTGTITLDFSGNPFIETSDYSLYTGARVMIVQRRAASHTKLALATGSGSSSGISVLGEYEFYAYGTYTGTVSIEAKDASGAWRVIRSFEATSDRQIIFRAATDAATELRITKSTSAASADATAYLEAADSRRVGYARITSGIPFDGGFPLVDAVVELALDSTAATTEWAIESWAPYAGYPRSVCFHEQRLWFGGTELEPNTFWASRINDFENFRRGAFDDDSLSFTLAASEGSAIQSMLSHNALVFFTQSEEWTASTSEQTAITPSNIFVRRQSRFGAAHRSAFVANNNILFLQRGARKLREFQYGAGGAQGQASDLTLLAEHVTLSGVRGMCFQSQPDPIVWCWTEDGLLLSLTFEVDQGVIAWARHPTAGAVESAALIYGDDFGGDELWLSTRRTINGATVRYIERMDSDWLAKLETEDYHSLVYSDSAVIKSADTPQDSFTGFAHLEGETLDILADGGATTATVSEGRVTLSTPARKIVAGLPFSSYLQPSKVELELQNGTAQARKFLCKNVTLNLWKTGAVSYADDDEAGASAWFTAQFPTLEPDAGEAAEPFTGLVDVVNLGAYNRSVDVTLRATGPLPCNILAMIPKIEVSNT